MLRNYASVGLIGLALGSWIALGDISQATAQKGGGGGGRGGGGGGGGRGGGGGGGGGARGGGGGGGARGGGAPSFGSMHSAPSGSHSMGPSIRSVGPGNAAIRSSPDAFRSGNINRSANVNPSANVNRSANFNPSANFNRSGDPRWNNNGHWNGDSWAWNHHHHHHDDFWRFAAYAVIADSFGYHPYGWWGPYGYGWGGYPYGYGGWGYSPYAGYPDVIYDRNVLPAGYAAQQSDGTALIEVVLPTDDARVWIDGNATSSRGTERRYNSPSLQAGHNYSYTVKASWITENGDLATVERQVPLSAGSRVLVDFTRSPLQRSIGAAKNQE